MQGVDNEQEVWGDDQLIASDVSIPFLLQGADWTGLFRHKGYEGQYPMVLFMYDEAERLHDALMAEINRTQVLSGDSQLRVDVYTRFEGEDDEVEGRAILVISGLSELDPLYTDDIIYLIRSGVSTWLTEAYSTHGVTASVAWSDSPADTLHIGWSEWIEEHCSMPDESGRRTFVASILPDRDL